MFFHSAYGRPGDEEFNIGKALPERNNTDTHGTIKDVNTPFSSPVQELLAKHAEYLADKAPKEHTPKVQVDEIATKIATFYEKARNLIDYQEAHLIRKAAIDRALRRRIFLKDISGKSISEALIKEIVRSGHLANNTIPESKIQEIQDPIDRLLALLEALREDTKVKYEDISEWLLGITVCEIEARLAPPSRDMMLANAMYTSMKDKLVVNGRTIPEFEKNTLLFVAIQKSLLRADSDLLHHRLLQFLYPAWYSFPLEEVRNVASQLGTMRSTVVHYEHHPLLPFFLRLSNRYTIVFSILGDMVFGSKPIEEWEAEAEIAYQDRFKREKQRLFRLAFFSIISFFFSKVLVALLIEVPIDLYILKEFSLPIAVANVIFPPFLMFVIVLAIKMPSEHNLYLVLEEIKAILFDAHKKNYTITVPKKKGILTRLLIQMVYLSVFGVSLYFLSQLLFAAHFTITNIVIFVLFTSAVTATGVKIFNRSKEISLEKEKPRVGMFFLDIFTIPLVTIGRWVISGLKRFNILIVFLNFVVELPFQLLVEFLESFNSFIKSKKEEIQ